MANARTQCQSKKGVSTMQESDDNYITLDQLRTGLYVYLDLKWFEHPFAFNNFKIKDEEQIKIIKTLGLTKVRYDPARGDAKPQPSQMKEAAVEEKPPLEAKAHPALAAKRSLIATI